MSRMPVWSVGTARGPTGNIVLCPPPNPDEIRTETRADNEFHEKIYGRDRK